MNKNTRKFFCNWFKLWAHTSKVRVIHSEQHCFDVALLRENLNKKGVKK